MVPPTHPVGSIEDATTCLGLRLLGRAGRELACELLLKRWPPLGVID